MPEIDDHGICQGNTGQILTQWRRPVASRVALDPIPKIGVCPGADNQDPLLITTNSTQNYQIYVGLWYEHCLSVHGLPQQSTQSIPHYHHPIYCH